MKKFIYLFSFFVLMFLAGCETTPVNSEKWMELEANACLPTAISFREGLKKYGVWSEVVRYSYFDSQKNKRSGHAIVAYLYPPGKNQLWTYDYTGSWRARAFVDNPLQIAKEAEASRGNYFREVYSAEFLK